MKMCYYLAALAEVFFSSCVLLIEVFFFYVVIIALCNCHFFLFHLTVLYITLHFLSQDGFPATVSFLTCKTCISKYENKRRKKKKEMT